MLRFYWTTAAVALFLSASATAATANNEPDPLFASDEILDIEIEAPFDLLISDRPDEDEVAGKLRYTADDGNLVEFDVALRTRGRLRRTIQICQFPPLRLNFKKSDVKGSLFDKQDRLKVVTHCRPQKRSEQAVLSEYLVYRIFNLFTDASFRVRLLRATYKYTDKNQQLQAYAIFIEHKDRIGKRLDAKTIKVRRANVLDIRRADLNIASVFQYFIGNTDFSPIGSAEGEDCCHNQVLFTREGEMHYTIPYDFDLSGLVNAPYAKPNSRFDLRSVRERLYRGRCLNNRYLPSTINLFKSKRSSIEALINDQPGLTKKTAGKMLKFISQFYETIDSPRQIEKNIIKKCI
jgi:hypothetical protein